VDNQDKKENGTGRRLFERARRGISNGTREEF